MSLTYSQFKDFLKRTMWRDGDTVLDADLDNLIAMADARLNRELRVNDMVTITTDNVEGESLTVPTGFLELQTISATDLSTQLVYITPHEMQKTRLDSPTAMKPFYSLAGTSLLFAGPMSAADPEPIELIYYSSLPDYSTADASWVADNYLDVYVFAALTHAGMYLREDARIPTWQSLYTDALTRANEAEIRRKFAGSPLQPSLPSGIA